MVGALPTGRLSATESRKWSTSKNLCNFVLRAKRNRFTAIRGHVHVFASSVRTKRLTTAYRWLLEANLRSRRPLLRIPLGSQHRQARMNWSSERPQCRCGGFSKSTTSCFPSMKAVLLVTLLPSSHRLSVTMNSPCDS